MVVKNIVIDFKNNSLKVEVADSLMIANKVEKQCSALIDKLLKELSKDQNIKEMIGGMKVE